MDLFGIDRVFGKHRTTDDWGYARQTRQRIMHQKLIADVSKLYPQLFSEAKEHFSSILSSSTGEVEIYSDEFRGITIASKPSSYSFSPPQLHLY